MLPAEDPIVYCQPPVGFADGPEGHTVFAKTGVPAASMFCEHLADADDAALMRLVHLMDSLD